MRGPRGALRVLAVALIILAPGMGIVGAEGLRVSREQLRPDPSIPDSLVFMLTVEKAGSYMARALVQGEEGRDFTIHLTLQPEGPAAAIELRFSFTGQGCG
jgi:hypothetical protein